MNININLEPVDHSLASSKSLYEAIEEECNAFLSTQKGLQYLLLKYPNLSLLNAIKEYKTNVWQNNNF